MKFTLFLISIILVNVATYCQENTLFPLEVGNKFFYKAGYYPDNGYYKEEKTILDTLPDGTRIIEIKNFYKDSTNIQTEYWSFSEGKFYSSIYSNNLGYPIYNGDLQNDTCIYNFPTNICYKLGDSLLYNQNSKYQLYKYSSFNKIESYKITFLTARNVGICYQYRSTASSQTTIKDSILLIGFIDKGILIGDSILTGIPSSNNFIVTSYLLSQNYPNPFNPTTKIEYSIPKTSIVTLKVYDILGREVATLVNEKKFRGIYEVEFDGNGLSSGIYFYKIQAGNYSSVKKMILVK